MMDLGQHLMIFTWIATGENIAVEQECYGDDDSWIC